MNALSLRSARVDLGGRAIWRDVDLEVPEGEFVAILGPNGAGKSTLLNAILGLVPLTAGEITVIGATGGRRESRHRLPPPAAELRPVGAHPRDRHRAARSRRRPLRHPAPHRTEPPGSGAVDELVELVGATVYARRPIGQCSGGEQQRLLIAEALARRPPLLLLDEPLDSLDLANQAGVAGLVARICRSVGVTVLIVAHDVNPILPYLDRVVYLGSGGAVSGDPEAVLTTETLSNLYQAPIEVLHASDGRLVVVGQPEATSYHPGLHADGH